MEPNETFLVTLSAPVNATLGTASAAVTISNDDVPLTVSISPASVNEGNNGTTTATMTVTLSAAAAVDVVVQVRVTGGTATAGSDYQAWSPVTKQVVIAAGQLSATFTVVITGDRTREANETVVVQIVGVTGGGATGVGNTGTLTIVDDDAKLTTTAAGPGADAVASADVSRVLAAAIAMWQAAGADTSLLAGVSVVVAPLPAGVLAEADGTTIRISPDAVGWGWSTSLDNVAVGRIDLLSVLVHELGHILGFEHTSTGVMVDLLDPGERIAMPCGLPAPSRGRKPKPVGNC